jgi:pimeloyl-ACP methyl ester carboxylesterase
MEIARGFIDGVFEAVDVTTSLVQRTHDTVAARWTTRLSTVEPLREPVEAVEGVRRVASAGVFGSIRLVNGVTRLAVGAAADVALRRADVDDPATPVESSAAGTASWSVDHLQATLNGIWGDHLSRRGSRLDAGMTLRQAGRALEPTSESLAGAFPGAGPRVCVFVHGLASTEWLWSLDAEAHYGDPTVTFGTRLRDDHGFTPVYVRYNTGRHISENGRALAELIDDLVTHWPVPVESITLVGHSMGGLVSRSAAHYGREARAPWTDRLRHIACIGSPHLGAPLEKAVHVLTGVLRGVRAAGAEVPAALLDSRSAGIKDLRYGYTVDEEWLGRDPDAVFADARRDIPLVEGVGYYFVATTLTRDPAHPVGQLLGDLMVRLPSARGHAPDPARRIRFADGRVLPGMDHVHIASHPAVYEALREFLAP